jgi:quercetin dioxygenase-like cupin family protein
MKMAEKNGWIKGVDKSVQESERGHVYKKREDLNWSPHPVNDKIKLGVLFTKKDEKVNVTCLLAKIPRGAEVPEHTHEFYDILFPLSGKGKVWIDGLGELELKSGVLVNIPPGVRHRICGVTEDLEVYAVTV